MEDKVDDDACELVEKHYVRAVSFARHMFPGDSEVESAAGEILCWAARDWVDRGCEGIFWRWARTYLRRRLIDDWRLRYGRTPKSARRQRMREYGLPRDLLIHTFDDIRFHPRQPLAVQDQVVREDLVVYEDDLTPEELAVASDLVEHVRSMMQRKLSARECELIELRFQGLTLREVGEVMGFTESRACQLRSGVEAKLSGPLGRSDAWTASS